MIDYAVSQWLTMKCFYIVLVIGRITEELQACTHTLNSLYGVLEEEMLEI